jgi:serine protease Do
MSRTLPPAFLALVSGALLLGLAPGCTQSSTEGAAGASAAVLAKVYPAVVKIEAIQMRPNEGHMIKLWIGGSGVIITPDGFVLTNYHVAEHADYFRCYLTDGTKADAHRVGGDALTDLALLKIDLGSEAGKARILPVAVFGDSSKLVAGETVFALGSPGFLTQSVTRGIVSNPSLVLPEETAGRMILDGEDVGQVVRWIFHDARIFNGNSGGPLVNARGEIVGINEIGVFNLSGAIPSNLARGIAEQLMAHVRVKRGWSGITVQPRLEADGPGVGVCVADVAPNSPAATAGILPGDTIEGCDGHPIEGAEEKAVAHFYRLEMGRLPGDAFTVDFERSGKKNSAKLTLTEREPALDENSELRTWGAVMQNVTAQLARTEGLPNTKGVLLESIRPGGPSGQGEPALRRQDVLVAVDGKPVANVEELRTLTTKLLDSAPGGVKTVLASVRRQGDLVVSVVELRKAKEPPGFTPQVRKAWLGVSSQPLTLKLAKQLGITSEGGARITRIYPGTPAETAGLKVGDVVLALDGDPVTARRAEDTEVFSRQIRQYRPGTEAAFSIWREGKTIELPVKLDREPRPTAETDRWEDEQLEFEARNLAFDDSVLMQLSPDFKAALISNVVPAGWAALAGLHPNDLVLAADSHPVSSIADLKASREAAVRSGARWWVLHVQRSRETLFVEINLKPVNP